MPDYSRHINTIHLIAADKLLPKADTLPLHATLLHREAVPMMELAGTNGLLCLNKGVVVQSASLALCDFEAVIESSRLSPYWLWATYSFNALAWLNMTLALSKSLEQATTGY